MAKMHRAMPNSQSGFSLLEVMISLAILSLVVGIVMPNSIRLVERYEKRNAVEKVRSSIEAQRAGAISSARTVVLDEADLQKIVGELKLTWPAQISASEPLVFSFAGVCNEVEITIRLSDDTSFQYWLNSDNCLLSVPVTQ